VNKLEPIVKDDHLRERWEKRAADEGSSKSSVLFRGLPKTLNEHVNDFQEYILLKYCLPRIKPSASILDLGCGYGRITKFVKQYDKSLNITGLDFSNHFCALYNKETSCRVVCADLNNTPFQNQSFDCIIAFTSLMYIPTNDRDKVMKNIASLLKPGGIGFFLDSGQEYIKLVSLIIPSRNKQSTGGNGFTTKEYDKLGCTNGLEIIHRGGMTFFSLSMPFLLLIKNFEIILTPFLKLVGWLDKIFYSSRFLSIHQWMVVKKTDVNN